jgi:hypothetical protein
MRGEVGMGDGLEVEFSAGQGVEESCLGFGVEAGFGHVADLGEDGGRG